MGIKILHTSDVHIGAKLSYLGTKSKEQRNQIRKTFENIIQTAIEQKVDLVAISGDLFDNPFPSKVNVNLVRTQFEKLSSANIKVAVIPGNHDYLAPGSVFVSDQMKFDDSNIHIFNDEKKTEWNIEELGLTVFGVPTVLQKSKKSPLSRVKGSATQAMPGGSSTSKGDSGSSPELNRRLQVALIHGSVDIMRKEEANYPISQEEIDASTFNYIALGDWHSKLEIGKGGKAWYCGSPELIGSDQKGSGNVLIVEIGDSETKVTPIKVGQREVVQEEIDLGKFKDLAELQKALGQNAGANMVKLVTLTGKKSLSFQVDLEELGEALRQKFFYLKIKDKTALELTKEELEKYPEELLVGRYIKLLRENKELEADIVEEAMQLGVRLLSEGDTNK
ncbi:MAG TPA: DNA repair exonuclease [bacterium]|nr:DNA repair exonuclease [bacterium]